MPINALSVPPYQDADYMALYMQNLVCICHADYPQRLLDCQLQSANPRYDPRWYR